MKRFQHYLLSLLALTLGLASCSKDKEYQRVIPSDASVVVALELESLAKKADVTSKENKLLREKLVSSMGSTDEEEKFFKETMESPSKTGLDLMSPVYGFSTPRVSWALVARVKDEAKVKDFLSKLYSFDGDTKHEIKQEDGIYFSISPSSSEAHRERYEQDPDLPAEEQDTTTYEVPADISICAFSKKAFITLHTEEGSIAAAKKLIKEYLTQGEDKSFVRSSYFRDLEAQGGDIRAFFSPTRLAKTEGLSMPPLLEALGKNPRYGKIDMEKISALFSLSFEKGEISGKMVYTSEDKDQIKYMKELSEKVSPEAISGALIKYLPAQAYVTGAAHVDLQAVLNHYTSNSEFAKLLEEAKTEGIDLAAIVTTLGRELACSFSKVDVASNDYGFVAYLQTKDASLVDLVSRKISESVKKKEAEGGEYPSKKLVDEGNHCYEVSIPYSPSIYFGYRDGVSYFTISKDMKSKILQPVSEDFSKHRDYAQLKGTHAFSLIDFKTIFNTSPTQDMIQMFIGEESMKQLRKLQSLSFSSNGFETELHLKLDTKDNALKALLGIMSALN